MCKIIPGILEHDWTEIEKKIEVAKNFTDTIHIDLIDGKFVQNSTFLDPRPFEKYKDLNLELHLMVEEPIIYLKPFAKVGFKRFLGHIEKMSNQAEFVAEGQLLGEVGLAVDLATPVSAIKVNLDDLDVVLLMSVKAGFSGQQFDNSVLGKIKELKEKSKIPVEIDGGVNENSIRFLKETGVERFIATNAIFGCEDPKANFLQIQNCLL